MGCSCHVGGQGDEVHWKVHNSGSVHGKNPTQSSTESWQEDGVRQGGRCQGEASTHHRQGVRSQGLEGQCVRQRAGQFAKVWHQGLSTWLLRGLSLWNTTEEA